MGLLIEEHGAGRRLDRHGEEDRTREEGKDPQTGQKPNATLRKRIFNFGFAALSEAVYKTVPFAGVCASGALLEGLWCRLPLMTLAEFSPKQLVVRVEPGSHKGLLRHHYHVVVDANSAWIFQRGEGNNSSSMCILQRWHLILLRR